MSKFIRNNSVFLDDECLFYLKLEVKRMDQGRESGLTADMRANAIIREKLTNENPSWVLAWERHQELRQKLGKDLKALEEEALREEDNEAP